MERIVVVVFENELKAYDGSRALSELDKEDSISIHSKAVLAKKDDGRIEVKEKGDEFPVRTVGGTAIGALIGLLGGPIGVAIGATAGTFTGLVLDMDRAGVDAEFLDDVSSRLTPGKWAIAADISEEWETPLDTRMATLGGTVFRTTRKNIVEQENAEDAASIRANIARLKEEQAKSKTEHKAKIQGKIDSLKMKLQAMREQAKEKAQKQTAETKAKIEALQKKAASAKGEAKAKYEARVAELKQLDKDIDSAFDQMDKDIEKALES